MSLLNEVTYICKVTLAVLSLVVFHFSLKCRSALPVKHAYDECFFSDGLSGWSVSICGAPGGTLASSVLARGNLGDRPHLSFFSFFFGRARNRATALLPV
jgi:hypothetical protein